MTEKTTPVEEISEDQLDDVAAGLLLPAVQSGGDGGSTLRAKPSPKVWPWHFW